MLSAVLMLMVGFILLSWAADSFVTGASLIAKRLGVSPLLIGLTIVALGTSSPEIVVSITAALKGNAGLAIGNAIGSNIANIGLVLGVTTLVAPLQVRSQTLRREYPILFLVMLLAWVLMLDGYLGQLDGSILIVGLILLMGWLIRIGLKDNQASVMGAEFEAELPQDMSLPTGCFWFVIGLGLLPLASHILVNNAIFIAQYFAISDLVIGLTIVAIGTSLPEIATAVVAAIKGEDDLAIGNIIGSNMFNILAVLPFPGLLDPKSINKDILHRDLPTMFMITILLFFFSYGFKTEGKINRWEGLILVATYLAYVLMIYMSA